MKYIQYYQKSISDNDLLVIGRGQGAIILLDAREKTLTHHDIARTLNGCNRPKFDAYTINSGKTLDSGVPITDLIHLN